MIRLLYSSSSPLKSKCSTDTVRVIDLRTGEEKTYDASCYDRSAAMIESTFYKEISIISGMTSVNVYYNFNLESDSYKVTVYHEKDCYWGSWKGKYCGFHFFLDNSNSLRFIGRIDSIHSSGDSSEQTETEKSKEEYKIDYDVSYNGGTISYDITKLSGDFILGISEVEDSKGFSFTEKSKVFEVSINEEYNCFQIGDFLFRDVVIKSPQLQLNDLSSRELINLMTNYDSVCDYSNTFGFGWKQGIKSRSDYYQLFRNRYDLREIKFADWLPSAETMFKCFENCFSLESIDITKIQGSATVFTRCFANCKKLKTVKILENRNECRIYGIFSGCLVLESITFPFLQLSASKKWNHDTGKLTDIRVPLMEKFMRF